jgi:excisionase family DNA binding protein
VEEPVIRKPVAIIPVPSQRVFGPKAAARYLGIDSDTIRKITELGQIKAYNFNGRRAYLLEDLDKLIESWKEWKNGAGENPLPFPTKKKGA